MIVPLSDRAVVSVSGSEARNFLQGLITNDVQSITAETPLYAALLTPQGKILFDFLIFDQEGQLLLDCPAVARDALAKRLSLYRLRAKVEIAPRDDLAVVWTAEPPGTLPLVRDPRRPALGYRAVIPSEPASAMTVQHPYTVLRLNAGVPEGSDFGQDRMFALDAGLDELGGIAFDKGCYVGQELTARMKHRGTARKRLLLVNAINGELLPEPPATITAHDRELGTLSASYGARGFALIRLDRLEEAALLPLEAGGLAIHVTKPDWLFS